MIPNLKIYSFAAAVIAAFFMSVVMVAYQKGQQAERAKAVEALANQLLERGEVDAVINEMSPSDLCHDLGGRMSDLGECE